MSDEGRTKYDTPGYGFIARHGGYNSAPGIIDSRCIGTISNGFGCAASSWTSAMEICNSKPDCGGFICWDRQGMAEVGIVVNWDDPSLWAKQCYPLLGPMQLGGAGQQNAFVKEGAAVTMSGATSVPFPAPPSAVPPPPPPAPPPAPSPPPSFPQQSPPAAEPHSADPNQPHEGESSIAASITDQPSVILPEDSTDPLTRASSIISGGRTLTGVVVSASNATGTSNGILGPDSTSRSNGFSGSSVGDTSNNGNASSSISSTAIIGIASVAAAIGVIGAVALAIFLRRKKRRTVDSVTKKPLYFSAPICSPYPNQFDGSTLNTGPASLGPGQAGVPNATGSTSVFVKTAAIKSTAPSSGFQGPVAVAMPSRMSQATTAHPARQNSSSPTPQISSLLAEATNSTYCQGSYTENPEKPEKQPSPTVQLGSKTQSQVPNRTAASTKPPYAPLAADTKVPFLHTQTSPVLAAPIPETAAVPSGMSAKSAYVREAESQVVHPQRWNSRQTLSWLCSKGIAPHIITAFENNCINGNDIWDMDAYRVSLLGLKASSADVINLLREIQNLRNDTALSNRLTLPTYQN